jgi:hypothetical protein
MSVCAGSRSLILLSWCTLMGRSDSEAASGSPETSVRCRSLGLRIVLLCPCQVGPCYGRMVRSQVAIWRAAASMLNKQSQTSGKGWPVSWGAREKGYRYGNCYVKSLVVGRGQ